MTYTTNYNLNIVEGTDVVNPLTQLNPNFTTIDGAMKNNADAAIDRAICIKSGTQHSVTRTNTDASVFRFTATGDWNTGDTMLVDTVPVSVYTPNGTALLDGAFVINTEVLCSIQGTRVVVYTSNMQASSIDASDVNYDNSGSGLVATNAQLAIDELRHSSNILYDNAISGLTASNVKDAIDELASAPTGGRTLIATATPNTSFNYQLLELKTAYNTLSADQKANAMIYRGSGNEIYQTFGTNIFSRTVCDSTAAVSKTLNIDVGTNYTVECIPASPYVRITNYSSSVISDSLKLYA